MDLGDKIIYHLEGQALNDIMTQLAHCEYLHVNARLTTKLIRLVWDPIQSPRLLKGILALSTKAQSRHGIR